MRLIERIREHFWAAFWKRQVRYLPPNAQVMITNNVVKMSAETKAPGITVNVGRDWDDNPPDLHVNAVHDSLIQDNRVYRHEED